MNLNESLAKAQSMGWSDDSRWTPSTVSHQMSEQRGDLLSAITIYVNGTIKWGVCSLSAKVASRRGDAPSVDAALEACNNTVSEIRGTLF